MTLAWTGITTTELFVVPVPYVLLRLSSPYWFTALLLCLSSYLFPWWRNLGACDWQVSLTEEIRWHSSPVAPSITELFDLCKLGTPTRSKTSTTQLMGTKIVITENSWPGGHMMIISVIMACLYQYSDAPLWVSLAEISVSHSFYWL